MMIKSPAADTKWPTTGGAGRGGDLCDQFVWGKWIADPGKLAKPHTPIWGVTLQRQEIRSHNPHSFGVWPQFCRRNIFAVFFLYRIVAALTD